MSSDYFWGVRSLTGAEDYVSRLAGGAHDLQENLAIIARHIYGSGTSTSNVQQPATTNQYKELERSTGRAISYTRAAAASLAKRTEVLEVELVMGYPSGLQRLVGRVIPHHGLFSGIAYDRRYWDVLHNRTGLRTDLELALEGIRLMEDSAKVGSLLHNLGGLKREIGRMILRRQIAGWSVVGGLAVGLGLGIYYSCRRLISHASRPGR